MFVEDGLNSKEIHITSAPGFKVDLQGRQIKRVSDIKQLLEQSDFKLTPGLIDIHTHGIEKFSYEDPEQLIAASQVLGKYGVTTVLPTVVPKPGEKDGFRELSELAAALNQITAVNIPGLHVEGPFVSLSGAGCNLADGDVDLLKDLVSACDYKVSVMSVAPDVKNIIPVIEWLVEHRIVPFITHTKADVEQTLKAIDAGARHATHFYDVFFPPDENDGGVRPVGCVETFLADERCSVDFICDGVHVHPMAIKAALAAKGSEKVILVTDSNTGAGLPEDTYDTPWGYKVYVSKKNGARINDPDHPKHGRLAGSALTMDEGINNLLDWLDLPEDQVWAMGTSNPARLLNLTSKGRLEEGLDADLVLWKRVDGVYKVVSTWVMGKCVYQDENINLSGVIEYE
jgi:N-acetylglucosamine-6-phosphate deacetylase